MREGRWDEALELQDRLYPLHAALFTDASPGPGQICAVADPQRTSRPSFGLPMTEPSDASEARGRRGARTCGADLNLVANPLPPPFDKKKIVAENRRARFDYFIEDKFEAGIELTGTEVKSLRSGEGSIAESYATVEGDEVWLINSHIPEYSHGNRLNHQPRRQRKLLLRAREIAKLHGAITRQGLTLVPLVDLFQRPRAGQDRAGARAGQEDARQA